MSAPRVCGDDPIDNGKGKGPGHVLPAYAGMIHGARLSNGVTKKVLPAYAGMIPVEGR